MNRPTVAILGASTNRSKFGNISLRAHAQMGYEVYPVNPRAATIEDWTAYPSLNDLPVKHVDRISVYLPPALLVKALDEIAALSHDELYLNPGTSSDEVLRRAAELELKPIQGCSIIDLGISPSEVL